MSRPTHLPGWTCPALDRLGELIAAHVPEPERTDALLMIEALRVAHVQLRHVASREDTKRAARAVALLEARIESKMAALAAGRTG